MSRLTYGDVEPASFDTPTSRRLTRESILQHVQPASQAIPADGVPSAGEADVCRAARARVHVLGPVRGHAVLPAGARPLPSRNLWGLGQLRGQAEPPGDHDAGPLDAGLRQ